MEKSIAQQRFSEIITKHLSGEVLTTDERTELSTLTKDNGFAVEQNEIILDENITFTDCYWICRGSNWSCNPDHPAPGCDCYKVCI